VLEPLKASIMRDFDTIFPTIFTIACIAALVVMAFRGMVA
jgi:hypothetical protein